ncbi:MAG: hypothetical protein HOL04_07960 [Gammaproteobacteria bacterium]|jgi:hypothetical protein|nr:hypothetical protein [Gammaproteobacteria bacterium]MBT4605541.1 hypothetical protein [Thiotrichales bacterium]MBT4081795.1 hypothetical protein [Gammaproteobacteria bacterium]MBT5361660.1 hypothetical protein [Gammaproteobacteria bacterium]MBT5635759.1 hypothetical protein [Gammaproteobacteria bacterium]
MSQPAQQKQKNILPLLIAAFALLLLFYLNSDEVDQQAHQQYLSRISHLVEHNASYSAELLSLNQRRKRSLSRLNHQSKELHHDLELLYQFPSWLDEKQHTELQKELQKLKRQIEHRVDLGERFARARSSYLNSLIQLPALKTRTERLLMDITLEDTEYREDFIFPLLELIERVEQFLLFPTKEEGALLGEELQQLLLRPILPTSPQHH